MASFGQESGFVRSGSVKSYWAALITGLFAPLLAYVGAIFTLQQVAPEHLPPPAITNQAHFDEKLRFLRHSSDFEPEVLAFGSSAVLRSLDFSPFQNMHGKRPLRYFNAGMPGATIAETRSISRFFISMFPNTKVVLTVVVPPDFASCSRPQKAFDPKDAAAFASGRGSSIWFYLKYFSIGRLAEMTQIADDRRMAATGSRRLFFDRFGSGPVEIEPEQARNIWGTYPLQPLDPVCFEQLRIWSGELRASGIALYLVTFPVNPGWLHETPGATAYLNQFNQRIRSALSEEPVAFVDGQALCECGPTDYIDAYHLQWNAAQRFSIDLAEVLLPQLKILLDAAPQPFGRALGSASTPREGSELGGG